MSRFAAVELDGTNGAAEASTVHAWRVKRLTELGLTSLAAEAVADSVDWHDVAKLVQRGCPADLAVAILN
jgi:hypothetical protein